MTPDDTLICAENFGDLVLEKEVEQIPQASEKNPLTAIKPFKQLKHSTLRLLLLVRPMSTPGSFLIS